MRRPQKSESTRLQAAVCPNSSCEKPIVKVEGRYIDNAPTEVTRYSRMGGKTLIARTYFHEDGTICDERLYQVKLRPLEQHERIYLRLGDPLIDPRT